MDRHQHRVSVSLQMVVDVGFVVGLVPLGSSFVDPRSGCCVDEKTTRVFFIYVCCVCVYTWSFSPIVCVAAVHTTQSENVPQNNCAQMMHTWYVFMWSRRQVALTKKVFFIMKRLYPPDMDTRSDGHPW